jgi:hypothetical protein
MRKKNYFIFEYCLTIVEIIEVKGVLIPIFVYKIMIAMNFFALAGYLFRDN